MRVKRLARSSCLAALAVGIGLSTAAQANGSKKHFGHNGFGNHGFGHHSFGDHGFGDHEKAKSFNRVAFFPAFRNGAEGAQAVSEIVAASTDGKTLIYTDSARKGVGFVDIADPSEPKPLGFIPLNGEPTSVAVRGPYVLAAVDTSNGNFTAPSGKLDIIKIDNRSVVRTIDLGGQPDSIAISKDGRYGAIAMENQRDEDVNDGQIPQLPGGFLAVIDFVGSPSSWSTRAVSLKGLADIAPEDPEPEYVDINDDNVAVVTLQENNHIALVDLKKGKVVNDFPAGTVDLKKIDTVDDNPSFISLTGSAKGLKREPDGVAWISSGPSSSQFAVTNEGDLDGGSRSFSIFDTKGRVKFDSGNELDHLAVRVGHYPDGRSDAKGNEPENVKFAKYGDTDYLFIASERANVVFVYEVGRDGKPAYKQTLPAGVGPEGLLAIPSRGLFIAASEEDGFDGTSREEVYRAGLSIYKLERGEPKYPTVTSADRPDHTPIPWGALSDLAISSSGKAYTLPDSVFAKTRVFEMSLNKSGPAVISREIVLKDAKGLLKAVAPSRVNTDGTVNLDGEGLSLSAAGGFWIASEGTTAADFPNLLIKASASGDILKVVSLPAATHARRTSNGFEGVIEEGRYVYVAFQREWSGDTPNRVRIGRYDTITGEWTFVYYPIETPTSPNGGWVGLSALTSLGRGEFAVIERDNQGGSEARIKRIYKFSLAAVTWRPESSTPGFAVVTKKLVRDLMPDLEATGGAVIEKIEGLAADRFGTLYVLTDNDGVDGSSGETQLFTVKPGVFAHK